MKNKIKVILTSYMEPDSQSGVRKYYQILQRHFSDFGIDGIIVTPSGCHRPLYWLMAVFYRSFLKKNIVRGSARILIPNLINWICLFSALKRCGVKPDLIHAQDPGSAAAAFFAFSGKKPILTTCHFNDDLTDEALLREGISEIKASLLRSWNEWTFKYARNWISVSNYACEKLLKQVPANATIRVIHNGVKFDCSKRVSPARKIRQEFPGKTLILTVGSLEPRKNQELVLRVAREMAGDPVVFLLAGDGPDRAVLEREIGRWDQKNVFLLGYRTDILSVMVACDICFHPVQNENCPFSVIEAISVGLPVFAAASGGTPEIFVGMEGESTFPLDTPPKNLALRLRSLVSEKEKRMKLAEMQYTFASQEFSENKMISETVRMYKDLTNGYLR